MRTRSLILVLFVVLAGCSAPGATVSVDAPTVTVEPGESGTLTVRSSHATSLHVDTHQSGPVQFDWRNDTVSPGVDLVLLSLPPSYQWEDPTAVTLALPYAVASNATAGTYRFTVLATGDSRDGENATTATGTVTVVVED